MQKNSTIKRRAFSSKIEPHHLLWVADALDLGIGEGGIDIGDHEICVEVKCRLDTWKSSGHAIHAYQFTDYPGQNPKKEMFWGSLQYGLSKKPQELLKETDLEKFVTYRKVWFFPWNWMKQFPVSSPKTGPYRYVHPKDILASGPFTEFKKEGGSLYLSKGCEALEQRLL